MGIFNRIPRREWKDLFIAWVAISVSFALIFIREMITQVGVHFIDIITIFGVAFVTAGISFVLHEMAHKFTAMKFGFWAEFQKDSQMLLVAIGLAALVGIVFAAPGVTMIYGTYITREQNGKISLSGPLTNLMLCIPFGALSFLNPLGMIGLVGMVGLQVNAMIAFFNMLPFGILDGKKIIAWNIPVFIATFAIALGTLLGALLFHL